MGSGHNGRVWRRRDAARLVAAPAGGRTGALRGQGGGAPEQQRRPARAAREQGAPGGDQATARPTRPTAPSHWSGGNRGPVQEPPRRREGPLNAERGPVTLSEEELLSLGRSLVLQLYRGE